MLIEHNLVSTLSSLHYLIISYLYGHVYRPVHMPVYIYTSLYTGLCKCIEACIQACVNLHAPCKIDTPRTKFTRPVQMDRSHENLFSL
jgi:hypothetical protein